MTTLARVLVVGDSGVGKSSLINKICYGNVLENPEWTVGCNVQVKLVNNNHHQESDFIEFYDVGCHQNYEESRRMYYRDIDGIILVYDISNWKSFINLRKWITELNRLLVVVDRKYYHAQSQPQSKDKNSFFRTMSGGNAMSTANIDGSSISSLEKQICGLPVLVVGNKVDLVRNWKHSKIPNVQRSLGYESINVSSIHSGEVEPMNVFIKNLIDTKNSLSASGMTSSSSSNDFGIVIDNINTDDDETGYYSVINNRAAASSIHTSSHENNLNDIEGGIIVHNNNNNNSSSNNISKSPASSASYFSRFMPFTGRSIKQNND